MSPIHDTSCTCVGKAKMSAVRKDFGGEVGPRPFIICRSQPYLWLHVGSHLSPLVRVPIERLHAHEQVPGVWHVKRASRTWKERGSNRITERQERKQAKQDGQSRHRPGQAPCRGLPAATKTLFDEEQKKLNAHIKKGHSCNPTQEGVCVR